MKDELVECPNSYHAGLGGEDKVHFAPEDEIKANGGVCAKCHESFRKRFHSQTARTHDTEHHEFAEGVAFIGSGDEHHAEPTVLPEDVDFMAVDGELESFGLTKYGATVLAKFCRRVLEVSGRNRETFFEAAHAICFAAHMHPDIELSGEQIAKKYFKTPKTKQAFFKHVNRFRDILGLARIAGAKSNKARRIYRAKMKASHERRKRNCPPQNRSQFFDRISAASRPARGKD